MPFLRCLLCLALVGATACDFADPPPPRRGGTSVSAEPRCASYLDCAQGFTCDGSGRCVEDDFEACACRELGCPEAPPCCLEGYYLDEELLCRPRCYGAAVSSDGRCPVPCDGPASCYATGATCGADGFCHEPEPACARAQLARPAEAGGPLLFAMAQDAIGEEGALCGKHVACVDGNVCQWSFQVYDPDGDLARSGSRLYEKLFWITPGGDRWATFDIPEMTGNLISFTGCFDEADTELEGAVQLDDEAGNSSNALCFEGSAP